MDRRRRLGYDLAQTIKRVKCFFVSDLYFYSGDAFLTPFRERKVKRHKSTSESKKETEVGRLGIFKDTEIIDRRPPVIKSKANLIITVACL